MFIHSERLFLRPCWPEESEELFTLLGDEHLAQNFVAPTDRIEVVRQSGAATDAPLPQFIITLPGASGARLIGAIALACLDGSDVELFACVAKVDRSRGYATEAVRAVLAQARALGHRRIVASHFEEDAAGARVLARAGFRPTGKVRLRPRQVHGERGQAVELAIELSALGGGDDPVMRAA